MAREIELTHKCVAIVDEEDYDSTRGRRWHMIDYGNGNRYAKATFDGKKVPLHRFIMKAKKGQIVDHINGDGLDNRKCNLRICTHTQNLQNQGSKSCGTSKYKGVSYFKRDNKYRAQIGMGGKNLFIGLFKCEHEAAEAYNKKAIEYYGEYARPNIINRTIAY